MSYSTHTVTPTGYASSGLGLSWSRGEKRSQPYSPLRGLHSGFQMLTVSPPPAPLYHLDAEVKTKTLGFRGRKKQRSLDQGFLPAEGRACSPNSPAGPPQCHGMSFLSVPDRGYALWSQSLCSLKTEKLRSDIHLHITAGDPA